MGVRLHPLNASPEQMELLAGVPAGTWARLQAYLSAGPKGGFHVFLEVHMW